MGTSNYRVIQWATGNTGQRALREVLRHPALDLVGVRVYDSAKEGVDGGELCGDASAPWSRALRSGSTSFRPGRVSRVRP